VREDGRIVGGEEWQEKVYNREKWKELLRIARNHHILHMPMEPFWYVVEIWVTALKLSHLHHGDDSMCHLL
jgi:polysaccharide deacetylase 2 family uncharacterized protein YibQ